MATEKIRLSNGTEFPCFGVSSRAIFYSGIQRDCLSFYFDTTLVNLADLVAAFTTENCDVITIVDESGEYQHYDYQIRNECGIARYSIVADGPVGREDDRDCLFVRMAQMTLQEKMLLEHDAAIDDLVISILEG